MTVDWIIIPGETEKIPFGYDHFCNNNKKRSLLLLLVVVSLLLFLLVVVVLILLLLIIPCSQILEISSVVGVHILSSCLLLFVRLRVVLCDTF